MARKLTFKQKKFVDKVVEYEGNGTKAALEVYNTVDYNTAGVIAHENLNKPKIQKALEEALPDDLLTKIHLEGLYATKPIYNKDNDLVGEDADFNARHKYLDTAYKLKGSYAPDKHITVSITEPHPRIKKLAEKLNE